MKSNKWFRFAIYTILLGLYLFVDIVYAKTTTELKFCEYASVLRTLKIIGLFIVFIKIIVPIVIIGMAISDFSKAVLSGKSDDLKNNFYIVIKRLIAGVVVFMLPTMVDYVFQNFVPASGKDLKTCSTCLLDINKCQIPSSDPDVWSD